MRTSQICCCFGFLAGLPRFTSQPEPSSVHRGGSALLGCEVTAELAPLLRWERDRQALAPDRRVLQLPSGALLITNASDADAGLYRCALDGGGTPKYSDEAELKVLPGTHCCSLH